MNYLNDYSRARVVSRNFVKSRRAAILSAGVLSVVGWCFAATGSESERGYTVTTVPLDAGNGINVVGQLVGNVANAGGVEHAALYFQGKVTDLGALASPSGDPALAPSSAAAVNQLGVAVGQSEGPDFFTHAVSFANGKVQDLGTLGGFNSSANAINDKGQIVGTSDTSANDGTQHAFVSSSKGLIDIGTLNGTGSSVASGINDFGMIVGQSSTTSGDTHAFIYHNGKITDIGTLGGTFSAATAINLEGIAVGYSTLSGDQVIHAFAYYRGKLQDLGDLGGNSSTANAINDFGQIVGVTNVGGTSTSHAFIYWFGQFQDLNNLIDPNSGWELTSASAINDKGEIIGTGIFNGTFQTFKLTPKDDWASGRNDLEIGRGLGGGGKRRSHPASAGWDFFVVRVEGLPEAKSLTIVTIRA
jgi:probable HAF family extracellular repeat protein